SAPARRSAVAMPCLPEQELLLRFPVLLRRPLEAAFGEELPAAENERDQNSGFGIRIAGPRTGSLRDPQRLAQRRLDPVVELVHSRLQPLVLVDERVADQHAGHPRIFLREAQQHGDDLLRLRGAVLRFFGDLVDQRVQRGFNELDQALEHLCLAREVAVQRGLGNVELRRKRGRGHLVAARIFQHRGERLQDLEPAFAVAGGHESGPYACLRFARAWTGLESSARIIVPTPSLVRTSSSSACSTRPSMMCELATPFRTASSAEPIFGSMPPWIVPSAKSASISRAVRPVSRLPSRSSTPTVLVISTSFSASSVSASFPATRSALMLYASPALPTPMGAITGMKSRESSSWMISGSIRSISPTRPMSTISPWLTSLFKSSL